VSDNPTHDPTTPERERPGPRRIESVLSRDPRSWLVVCGPGAVMASLTIGTGELIFSTRGGALFGERILFAFLAISVCKWALVFAAARHVVLTGAHPFERWTQLPGPRGWLPIVFLVLAVPCLPIWSGFHSSVTGNYLANLTGTQAAFGGAAQYLWGGGVLAVVLFAAFAGGYTTLERVQSVIVAVLLVSVAIALVVLGPDWIDLILGAVVPRPLEYLPWVHEAAARANEPLRVDPVWIESTLYVGVIGGAGYDYLAYVSFLREKRWGRSAGPIATRDELERVAADPRHPDRRWLRAPLIDCTVSFAAVFAFSAVFVASGYLVLAPRGTIPDERDFLAQQAEFVRGLSPLLVPIYSLGAILALVGTLYGTIEVAPTVLREARRALGYADPRRDELRLRRLAIAWCGVGAAGLLAAFFVATWSTDALATRVTSWLKPANLFTGVLSCGIICALNCWADRRFLPPGLRPSSTLSAINAIAAAAFLFLGIKGYWDYGVDQHGGPPGGVFALAIPALLFALGWIFAHFLNLRRGK